MAKPSETARRVAFARAWEMQQPEQTRLCSDHIAQHLLSDEGVYLLTTPEGRAYFDENFAGPVWDSFLDYVALRTRVIDSMVLELAQDSLGQLVVLGAGYDSRTVRMSELIGKVKMIEVDRAATQEDKKDKLIKHFGALPEHITYLAVDFEEDDLVQSLDRAGFDPGLKTLFTWEGVTVYLDPAAVDQTLRLIGSLAPAGSRLIFDYARPDFIDGEKQGDLAAAYTKMTAELGEPLKFALDPQDLERYLAERGFGLVENLDMDQCMQKYLAPEHGQRQPISEFNIAQAEVV